MVSEPEYIPLPSEPPPVLSVPGAHWLPFHFSTCPDVAPCWPISVTESAPAPTLLESTALSAILIVVIAAVSTVHVAPDALTSISPLSPSVNDGPNTSEKESAVVPSVIGGAVSSLKYLFPLVVPRLTNTITPRSPSVASKSLLLLHAPDDTSYIPFWVPLVWFLTRQRSPDCNTILSIVCKPVSVILAVVAASTLSFVVLF